MSALTLSRRIPAADRPAITLALLPSLGTTTHVWNPLLAAFAGLSRIDVLLFDLPGHGRAPAETGFRLPDLADGTADVIAETRPTAPVVVAGVSMGGALAVEIVRRRPDVAVALASFNSAVRFGSPTGWAHIIETVTAAGTAAHDVEGSRRGWFTAEFTATPSGALAAERMLADLAAFDPDSYIACCRALADYDGSTVEPPARAPGIAVGGAADRATPAAGMRELAHLGDAIRYAELPGAHLAVVENAAAAAVLLDDLLRRVEHGQETTA